MDDIRIQAEPESDRRTGDGAGIRRYIEAVRLIERMHRQFLEVVRIEIDRSGIDGINPVQAVLLFNMGHDEMSIGELMNRGHYLGSNVSYNVDKLVLGGFIERVRSPHDRRSHRVRLSERGQAVRAVLVAMFSRQQERLPTLDVAPGDIDAAMTTLGRVEKMWLLAERGLA